MKNPIIYHVRIDEGCIDLVSGDTHVCKIPYDKADGTEAIGDMSFNEACLLASK